MKAALKWVLVLLCFVLVAWLSLGCTSISRSATTSMDVHRAKDGEFRFRYVSPKDQTLGWLKIDPESKTIVVSNLSSQVDQATVQAARDARIAESQAMQSMLTGVLSMAQDALRARAGMPPMSVLATNAASFPAAPAGMKWVLKPADDPSVPTLETNGFQR